MECNLHYVAVGLALAVAVFCVVHPRVHTGILGTTLGGGAVLFAVAGVESQPPAWVTMQVLFMAGAFAWFAAGQLRGGR